MADGPVGVAGERRVFGEQFGLTQADLGAGVLVVSQFTLYADTRKGRRPSWSAAAPGAVSEPIYESFCASLSDLGADVQTGVFGGDMAVSLVNDGPVTILLDSDA